MQLRALLTSIMMAGVLFMLAALPASAQTEDCTGKGKKACEIPEVPWTLILPATGGALVIGYYLVQRRRDRRAASAGVE